MVLEYSLSSHVELWLRFSVSGQSLYHYNPRRHTCLFYDTIYKYANVFHLISCIYVVHITLAKDNVNYNDNYWWLSNNDSYLLEAKRQPHIFAHNQYVKSNHAQHCKACITVQTVKWQELTECLLWQLGTAQDGILRWQRKKQPQVVCRHYTLHKYGNCFKHQTWWKTIILVLRLMNIH